MANVNRWFHFCIAVIALMALVILSRTQMIPIFAPHDDLLYVKLSEIWYWGKTSDPFFLRFPALFKPPGFPLWIAVTQLLPLPFQLCNELLYLGSAWYLVSRVASLFQNRLWCVPIFAFIVLHPLVFNTFQSVTIDTFFASVWMIFLGLLLQQIMGTVSLGQMLVTGLVCALLLQTRLDDITVTSAICVPLFVDVIRQWRAGISVRLMLNSQACLAFLIQAGVMAWITLLICVANNYRYGVFTDRIIRMNGAWSLMSVLASLEGNDPAPSLPVRMKTIRLAATESPTLKALLPFLDREPGVTWKGVARWEGMPEGEVGHTLYWFFWDIAVFAGVVSLEDRDRLLTQAAVEVAIACKEGKFRCNSVPALFWPLPPVTMSHTVSAVKSVIEQTFIPGPFVDGKGEFGNRKRVRTEAVEVVSPYRRIDTNRSVFFSEKPWPEHIKDVFAAGYTFFYFMMVLAGLVACVVFVRTLRRGIWDEKKVQMLCVLGLLFIVRESIFTVLRVFMSPYLNDRYFLPVQSLIALIAGICIASVMDRKDKAIANS